MSISDGSNHILITSTDLRWSLCSYTEPENPLSTPWHFACLSGRYVSLADSRFPSLILDSNSNRVLQLYSVNVAERLEATAESMTCVPPILPTDASVIDSIVEMVVLILPFIFNAAIGPWTAGARRSRCPKRIACSERLFTAEWSSWLIPVILDTVGCPAFHPRGNRSCWDDIDIEQKLRKAVFMPTLHDPRTLHNASCAPASQINPSPSA